jgi:hypothetical protein
VELIALCWTCVTCVCSTGAGLASVCRPRTVLLRCRTPSWSAWDTRLLCAGRGWGLTRSSGIYCASTRGQLLPIRGWRGSANVGQCWYWKALCFRSGGGDPLLCSTPGFSCTQVNQSDICTWTTETINRNRNEWRGHHHGDLELSGKAAGLWHTVPNLCGNYVFYFSWFAARICEKKVKCKV